MAEIMEFSKPFSALIFMLFLSISSFHTAFGCGECPKHKHPKEPPIPPVIGNPPITLPPVIGKPPVTLPPIIGKPPITLPPVLPPIIGLPPVIGTPLLPVPPVIGTPVLPVPPIIGTPKLPVPPVTGTPGCPPPPSSPAPKTCPVDTVKLGACLEILGNVVHIGDPAVDHCCPIIEGLAGIEAAFCLCTTISWKLLNINIFFPIALELLATCGKSVPPGYTCP